MLATLLIPIALAKPLPNDAARGPVAAGTPFEVIGLSKDDAYYSSDRRSIVGVRCTADEALALNDPKGYYGGPATCDDGSRYFYKVALRVTGEPAIVVAPPEPERQAGETPSRPFFVTDIHPDDAYFSSKDDVIGLLCVSQSDGLHENAPGWWGGGADCQDGSNRYFYEAAIQTDLPVIPAGTPFRIADVGAKDAYADSKPTLVGRSCTAAGALQADGGWYGGAMLCGTDSYVFYNVALVTGDRPVVASGAPALDPAHAEPAVAAPGDLEPRYDGPTVQAKTEVRIVNIGEYDSWSYRHDALVGQDCKVKKPLEPIGDGWYQGLLVCSGSQLAFTQVAVSLR